MKARRLSCPAVRQIEVIEFDLPAVPDDGILVQNEHTLVSVGTELYGYMHGAEPGQERKFPRGTGYCSAGIVLEVGSAVTDVKPGDRVAGQGNHASHSILRGGGTTYQKVPTDLSSRSAVFMVMGAIAIHGTRVARIELGEVIAVLGLGIVGQLAATLSSISGGMPVIGIDLNPFRIDKARARGLDVLLNPGDIEDLPAALREHAIEDGANVVLESTGVPAVYPTAVKIACTGGRVVALGSPRGTVEMDFLADVHLREVSILGAIQPKTPNEDHIYYRFAKDRERKLVIRLMANGKLPVEDLITHEAQPEECQDIYTMLADDPKEALGVVFDWAE
jgi:2-desacetyl-2-hydroxyethyl bacteriochlorophyllide A dehydrogenase